MGLLIGGAVFPAAFSITWKKQTRLGAISGCIAGLAAGLTAWLVTAKCYYGGITVATTGGNYPTLAGNVAAILTGFIVTVTLSMIKPDDFDWEITRAINALPISDGVGVDRPGTASSNSDAASGEDMDEKKPGSTTPSQPPALCAVDAEAALHISYGAEDSPASLRSSFKLACISSFVLAFLMDFLIPMPMFFSHYIFSKGFFTVWVVVSFVWVFVSSAISCFLPIWETRGFFGELVGRIRRGQVQKN
jgi:hypothetical protein